MLKHDLIHSISNFEENFVRYYRLKLKLRSRSKNHFIVKGAMSQNDAKEA